MDRNLLPQVTSVRSGELIRMLEEEQDASGIKKTISAYQFYSREHSSKVRDELIAQGKDSGMGDVVKIVAAQWRALPVEQKEPYETMHKADKKRYKEACDARDAQALAEQEARRAKNTAIGETETRMRGATLANSEAMAVKQSAPKKTRELTEKEITERDARRAEKKKETERLSKADAEMKKVRAEQAEARLKFLLSQSDIFSHFGGKGKGAPPAESSSSSSSGAMQSPGSSRRKIGSSTQNLTELDADETAMIEDEAGSLASDDEDEEGGTNKSGKSKKGTVLRAQPSIISGGQLREYQLEGLNWMIRLQENGINGILADEMGLGKTLQSISILAYQWQHLGVKGPHLIMVPKSTLSNWMNEFKRFCPSIKVIRFHGSKDEREIFANEHLKLSRQDQKPNWDVCVTTYEVVNLERNILTKIHWQYLIIDEAHRLKNEASQFSKTVRQLKTHNRLLLTGTPLQNNLHELWALLNFLLPDVFASAEQFDEWFDLDIDDVDAKQRVISQLHKLLRPFMLRRLKVDVEKSLPPKTETILFVGLSAMQKKLYKDILMRDIDLVNSSSKDDSKGSGKTAVLNIVMQLRKACNHPYLFPGQEDRALDPLGSHLEQNCGKMVLLGKLLRKMKERGHRVLVFSQMTRMIDILEDFFVSQGYKYCRIDGNTSYEDREDRIAAYNAPNSEKFIFVLSTRAGGLGINLQTADTVILYDSDWNPQADLQAQDRAHRIGQKKPVQIFRLVTEDTVEVKVVERAQQKLKLDAMVVQQGRLQEKEKKMSKQELLETIKFGADKIFRSKDSSISEDDIDAILEAGRKRTEAMGASLSSAEKGDMYDFRLDGGMKAQQFDGVDYSDRNARDAEAAALASLAFIDPGKRERKVVTSYAENVQGKGGPETDADGKKVQKIPRHLRLPRMDEWQFYNRARLEELHAIELKIFEGMVENNTVPAPNSGTLSKLVLLDAPLHEEKERLLAEGFREWSKQLFNAFIKASARHGRANYDKIALDMMLDIREVERYGGIFWSRGAEFLGDEFATKVRQIEKGERHLEEIERLSRATSKLISKFSNPWEELTFRSIGSTNRIFNAAEDRFLLCLTHVHGYGNWDRVRTSIKRSDRFRFDFSLQCASEEQIGKRCELLMRSAEKELLDIEKKEAEEGASAGPSGSSSSAIKSGDNEDRLKIKEITKKQAADAKKLATIRAQLAAARKPAQDEEEGATDKGKVGTKAAKTTSVIPGAPAKLTATIKPSEPLPKGGAAAGAEPKKAAKARIKAEGSSGKGKTVPESMMPEFVKFVEDNATLNLDKMKTEFTKIHPEIPKRQVEFKLQQIAYKSGKKWVVTEEAKGYLTGNPPTLGSSGDGVSPPAKKAKTEAGSSSKGDDGDSGSPSTGNKRPADGADGEPEKKKKKKELSGFGHFVNVKKPSLKTEHKAAMDAMSAEDSKKFLKEKIMSAWQEMDEAAQADWEARAQALNAAN